MTMDHEGNTGWGTVAFRASLRGNKRFGVVAVAVVAASALCGCVRARFFDLGGLSAKQPIAPRAEGWQRELDEVIDEYERKPVTWPVDSMLAPIAPAIATIGYYGTDIGEKARDQDLEAPDAAAVSLTEACASPRTADRDAEPSVLGNPPRPDYRAAWIPLPIDGKTALADVTCNRGVSSAPATHFCLYSRWALHRQPAPVVLIVPGLFDSVRQRYVETIGDVLYDQGFAVALLDMRDHGDTLRANSKVPMSFGEYESFDLVAVAALARSVCGAPHVGAIGVSGGGLVVIRGYGRGLGGSPPFDLGALAISPLLEVDSTINAVRKAAGDDRAHGPTCMATRALELPNAIHVVGPVAGLVVGGATAVGGAWNGRDDNSWDIARHALVVGGLTAGVLLIATVLTDKYGDGSSYPCMSIAPIADLFMQLFDRRSAALAAAEHTAKLTLDQYLAERVDGFYRRLTGHPPGRRTLRDVATALELPPAAALPTGRLAAIGSVDDPVVGHSLVKLGLQLGAMRTDLYFKNVGRGGHGAFPVIHQTLSRRFLLTYFCGGPWVCPTTADAPAVSALPRNGSP
jgi:hypothetical protein